MKSNWLFATLRWIFVLLSLASYCVAGAIPDNAIHDVNVCDLLQRPGSYDGQVVHFRGQLYFEFEGHHVHDEICNPPMPHTGIWWNYGGEMVPALEPEASRIRKLTGPILKDESFADFETRVHAHRSLRPDGQPCYSYRACAFYDVVGTFTGVFFAGDLKNPQGRMPGYGHMGCCHLFVIEQISDVDATKTPVPSDDTKFTCRSESWQSEFSRQETHDLETHLAGNRKFLAEQMEAHGDQSLVEDMNRELSPYADLTGFLNWSSPDLLTTYRVQYPQTSNSKKKAKHREPAPAAPLVVDVTREFCKQTEN